MCGGGPPPGKTLASIKLYVPPVSSFDATIVLMSPTIAMCFPLLGSTIFTFLFSNATPSKTPVNCAKGSHYDASVYHSCIDNRYPIADMNGKSTGICVV